VRRGRAVIAVALTLVALVAVAVAVAAGGDHQATTARPAPSESPPPRGALPPAFVKCMADRGFPIESPAEIHWAPPEVLQACFAALHEGG
jgi:hypothetical protein